MQVEAEMTLKEADDRGEEGDNSRDDSRDSYSAYGTMRGTGDLTSVRSVILACTWQESDGEGPDFVPGPFRAIIIERLVREAAHEGVYLDPECQQTHLRAIQVEGNYPGAGVDLTRALCQDDRQRVAMRGWSSVSTMATPSLTRISCTV